MKLRKRVLATTGILALLITTSGFKTMDEQVAPGDQSLVNLQHVYNRPSSGAAVDGQGTDIEFYTSTVPLRDYTTGELILDEENNPIPVDKDFAIMGSYLGGAYVYDITDPETVQFVTRITCNQTQNDVQIKKLGEQWVLALARDGSGTPCNTGVPNFGAASGGIAVIDVTDPYAFTRLYNVRVPSGAHNFTFHPTKPFGYVSAGDIVGASHLGGVAAYRQAVSIINFTDLMSPTQKEFTVTGSPHDISFSQDGTRAYLASENNALIYNTNDPDNPVLVTTQRVQNVGTYSHGFDPTPNKTIAVHTNESLALGGFFAGGTTVCPGEGLTFYDISGANEANPVPKGYYLPTNLVGPPPPLDSRACTGHVGRIAPNNHVLTTGWYIGGVRVVDFADPAMPTEVGHAVMTGAEVWAAKTYKGPYIYSADMRRGFDVFRWSGTGTAPWLAP